MSANAKNANCAVNIPTKVRNRNTWGRNDRCEPLPDVISLRLGPLPLFAELDVVLTFHVPAVGAGGDLVVGGIFGSPLLLFGALLYAVVDGLTAFAFFGATLLVAFPAGFLFHFFLPPFLGLGLVDLVP